LSAALDSREGAPADLIAGEHALRAAASIFEAALGNRLLAAYALGSLAHGGFCEAVSDLDLGLILEDPANVSDEQTVNVIADEVRRGGGPLHSRLSVFWGTPSTLSGKRDGGRFPALDRLDLIEHGKLILGSDDIRQGLRRPTAAELLLSGAQFALARLAGIDVNPETSRSAAAARTPEAIEAIRSPELLLPGGVRRVTKAVLFPVRFLFTAASGRVATNDVAVESFLADRDSPSHPLVAAARAWRASPTGWETEAAGLLRGEIVPLYLHYIDDHVMRLEHLGEIALALAFRKWRERLLAAR
jgi:hypothetical protein